MLGGPHVVLLQEKLPAKETEALLEMEWKSSSF